jgi:hypothetical protein
LIHLEKLSKEEPPIQRVLLFLEGVFPAETGIDDPECGVNEKSTSLLRKKKENPYSEITNTIAERYW